MKIKILLSALAAAMLLMPSMYATSSNEGAGQSKSPAPAQAQAAPHQIGDQMQGLPDDTRALESAVTTTDAAARPATVFRSATKDAAETTALTVTEQATRDCIGCNDRPTKAHRPEQDPVTKGAGFGIASMVFGILALTAGWFVGALAILFALLAIIFGGIGLGRRRRGKGMAIAGLVMGILYFVLVLLVFALLLAIFL